MNENTNNTQASIGCKGIMAYLPSNVRKGILAMPDAYVNHIEEIRLRVNSPVTVKIKGKMFETEIFCTKDDIDAAVRLITSNSFYALENCIKQGFITLPGGHRVGFVGRAVAENGSIKGQRDIGFLNYRVARITNSCNEKILHYLFNNGTFLNTLIFSPPGGGKTSLLRSLAVMLSDGTSAFSAHNVFVVDERSEMAGFSRGEPLFYVGKHTDILDNAPKAEGIMLGIRSMAPDIIITDEIGKNEDGTAICEAINCGIGVLASAHGGSFAELQQRSALKNLIGNNSFQRFIALGDRYAPGVIKGVYNSKGELLTYGS